MSNTLPKPAQIAVLISGSGSNLQAIIDACQGWNNPEILEAEICLVISNNPEAYGLERAKKAGIPTLVLDHRDYDTREEYDTALVQVLQSSGSLASSLTSSLTSSSNSSPDLVVLAGFMRILTPIFTQAFATKLINIHPSLLPKYPGLHTHKRAIDSGDTKQGATVHFVTAELDGGPPILQGAIDIQESDTEESLAARVLTEIEHKLYPLAVEWVLTKRATMHKGRAYLDGELLPESGFQYPS